MGRPAKFTLDQLLDAAARLVVKGGPTALTASAVAKAVGAPSGSIYHRFASRDDLAAALWMRTVERFDADVVSGLASTDDPLEVANDVAVAVVRWSTDRPVDAHILTLYRRTDLVDGEVAPDIAQRAAALGDRQRSAIEAFAQRLGRPPELVRFAVAGIPMTAIREHVGERAAIPRWVEAAVARAVRAVLTEDHGQGEQS